MKKFTVFLLVVVIAMAGGIGIGFYFGTGDVTSASENFLNSKEIEKRTFKVEELQSNLSDGFIRLSLSFVTDSEKAAKELAKRDFQIKNFVIQMLTSTESNKLSQSEEIVKLQDNIKTYINNQMQTGEVVEVYVNQKLIMQ